MIILNSATSIWPAFVLKWSVEFWLSSLYVIRIADGSLLTVIVNKSWHVRQNKFCIYFRFGFEFHVCIFSLNTVSCTDVPDKLLIKPEESRGGISRTLPEYFRARFSTVVLLSLSHPHLQHCHDIFFIALPPNQATQVNTHSTSCFTFHYKISVYFNY